MKSATEFGAHAENYSRIWYGLNSNVFFALLVPSAFSPVATSSVLLRKKEKENSTYSFIYSCVQYLAVS